VGEGLIKAVFERAWEEFLHNFKIALAFGLLLVFSFFFVLFPNIFLGSGSFFLEFAFLKESVKNSLAQIVLVLAYLLFYAVFSAIIIFSVRKDLTHVRFEHYLVEVLPRFWIGLVKFFVLYSVLVMAIGIILVGLGAPMALVALVLLVISLALLFVPQAIVIDEEDLKHAVQNNLEFIRQSPKLFVAVVVTGAVLLAVLQLVELTFDSYAFSGRFVSIVLLSVLVLPFMEVLKSVAYLSKFGIVRHTTLRMRHHKAR
jgi:hypothetical protein